MFGVGLWCVTVCCKTAVLTGIWVVLRADEVAVLRLFGADVVLLRLMRNMLNDKWTGFNLGSAGINKATFNNNVNK